MTTLRELALALFLVVASVLVVSGVSRYSEPLALITAGVLLAVLAVVFFAEVG